MSESAQTPTSSATATDAAASADRLIRLVQNINQVDVAASSLADRTAVVELLEVTTDEQRSSLLLALLLQRLGTDA